MKGVEFTLTQAIEHQQRVGPPFPQWYLDLMEKREAPEPAVKRDGITKKGEMTKIEREFSLILESQRQRGEIIRWDYEPLTFRWRDPETKELMRYTPDFMVLRSNKTLPKGDKPWAPLFIETKGNKPWERPLERFRHARTYYSCFAFECWQKLDGRWGRLL